jgi:hypothetical protein
MRQVLQEQQLDRPADYSLVLKGADPLRFGRLRASEQALTFSMSLPQSGVRLWRSVRAVALCVHTCSGFICRYAGLKDTAAATKGAKKGKSGKVSKSPQPNTREHNLVCPCAGTLSLTSNTNLFPTLCTCFALSLLNRTPLVAPHQQAEGSRP